MDYKNNCGYCDYGKKPCGEYAECALCPDNPENKELTNDLVKN